ncbi:MAG: FAD:protein FMN transferase, partial [Ruminococcus flavefaciens]|nr:FAD:protein FMN transferase [Ruminococcus flavefaciens]
MKSSDNDKRKLHTLRLIAFLPLFLISAAVLLNGCAKNTEPTSRTGFYFDTVIQITLYDTEAETLLDG